VIALSLDSGDQLGWVRLTDGSNEIIMVTEQGKALRFDENQVRPMGRAAAGVTGIRLGSKDHVTSMEVIEPGGFLLTITTKGYGKRTPLDDFPAKNRAVGGVQVSNPGALAKIGLITSARVVQEPDDLTLISANGVVLRLMVKDISEMGRTARGVLIFKLQAGDTVASTARVAKAELVSAGADE